MVMMAGGQSEAKDAAKHPKNAHDSPPNNYPGLNVRSTNVDKPWTRSWLEK